jgi:competence protein ComEA
MPRIVALTFVLAFACCSSRVEYASKETPASPGAININTASREELEALPHIGRKTAETIVVFREQNGPFRRVEHLLLIRGMSESRFEELRPMLRIE